jgi:predicted transcriptional regulator
MEILWGQAGNEVSGRAVADALDRYAYTTVATVLDRLVHKGLVRRRLDGRTIRFSAIGTEATHTAVVMRDALSVSSDRASSLAQFAEHLSPSEAAVLRRSLDGLEREPGR